MAVYAVPSDRSFSTSKPLKRKNSPEVKARLKEGFELLEKMKKGKVSFDFEKDLMIIENGDYEQHGE